MCCGMPRICSSARASAGRRRATSTSAWSASTCPTGRSSSRAVRSRHAPSARAAARCLPRELVDLRQPPPDLVGVALVGDVLQVAALLARPLEPALLVEALLERGRELEQVLDVAARVVDLLLRQRPLVPAREARGLRHADAEHVVQHVAVAHLRAQAAEPAAICVSKMFVTSVATTRRRIATSWRPACMTTSIVGVGQHLGERLVVEARAVERVEHGHVDLVAVAVRDRDLHEAQQRLVAPLGHELGVDADSPTGAGALGKRGGGRHGYFFAASKYGFSPDAWSVTSTTCWISGTLSRIATSIPWWSVTDAMPQPWQPPCSRT